MDPWRRTLLWAEENQKLLVPTKHLVPATKPKPRLAPLYGFVTGTSSEDEPDMITLDNDPSTKQKENQKLLVPTTHLVPTPKPKPRLAPLYGFVTVTSSEDEPDMITLDNDPSTKRAKMPCGHVISEYAV